MNNRALRQREREYPGSINWPRRHEFGRTEVVFVSSSKVTMRKRKAQTGRPLSGPAIALPQDRYRRGNRPCRRTYNRRNPSEVDGLRIPRLFLRRYVDQAEALFLERKRPPLINIPPSHGTHHPMRTRYSNSRESLAIRMVTSPGGMHPRCNSPIPVLLISRVMADMMFPRRVTTSAGTDNSSRSALRILSSVCLSMLSRMRRRSSREGRLQGSRMAIVTGR